MSGTHGALRLIELTSARFCHDLSGLVGSLDHAVAAPADGSALVPDHERAVLNTTRALTAHLALRRAAWGPDGEPLPLERMEFLARGLPEQVIVDASALDPGTTFPAATGRIVLNLLLLAADSLPSGGVVVLAGAAGDLFIKIAGPGAAWPAGMTLCLTDETQARAALTEGRSLQMALTTLLAHAAGERLSVLIGPTAGNEPAMLRLGG